MIESFPSLIITLQCITVDNPKLLIETHSPRSLLIEFTINRQGSWGAPILSLVLESEGTLHIVKVETVLGDETRDQLVTQLILHCLHRAIAQYEAALSYCMGMQVYIDEA
jgi:hypothetical protein